MVINEWMQGSASIVPVERLGSILKTKNSLRNLQLQGILPPPHYLLSSVVILFQLAISVASFYTCYKSFDPKQPLKDVFWLGFQ